MAAPTDTAPEHACHTCEIVATYVDLANSFTQEISDALVVPMQVVFLSFVGIWIVVQGYRLALTRATIHDLGKEFIYVIISWMLLATTGPELVNRIFQVALQIMGAAAAVALKTANKTAEWPAPNSSSIGAGMTDLVSAAESGVVGVFGMAQNLAASAAWNNWLPVIYAVVLIVPYFLVLIVYFSQVVVSIFRITMLATISPYLMLGFGFGWGRPMALKGLNTLLSSFMVLFGATLALAIMLYGVTSLEIAAPQSVDGLNNILNPNYLVAVALGWLGTAFMTEATGIANSITGSALSNSAAGVITAGAAATGIGLAKYGRIGLGSLPMLGMDSKTGQLTLNGQNISERANQLVQKALKQDQPQKK
ncbi:type IV secretion system protein [Ferrovibrio sp.]|uniref:type IV secretion system protein n=1 Tax=Ferrovibrio sp. TaxID=1917215 RepID=UPI00311E8DCD